MTYPEVTRQIGDLCFDFDGVLAEKTWPSPHIGAPIKEGLDALTHYARAGWAIFILTARPPSHFDRIWRWLHQQNVHWFVYDVVNVKVPADAYIDDKAVPFPFVEAS